MPFALLIVGALLIITAIRGTYGDLGTQLSSDLVGSGSKSFLVWIAAIAAVGALGYSTTLRTPSRLLLALIFLGILISNHGFFANLTSAVENPPATAPVPAADQPPALTGSIPVSVAQTGGGAGSAASTATSAASTFLKAIPLIGGLF
jgi:hypothetical protein